MVPFFFTNHHISWQWADGNPSTLCFFSKWPEWNFLITLRSQASFFSFFSCFLERACTSFVVYELILIFPIFFKKVMYISKALYIAEKSSKPAFWYDGPKKASNQTKARFLTVCFAVLLTPFLFPALFIFCLVIRPCL